jgi:hypothetical protein
MGDMIAGISGLVLIISPFLDWYSISAKNSVVDFSVSGSGWDALSWVPWIVTLCGLAAIALAVVRATGANLPQLPASPGFIVLALGALSTILVLFRILVTPDAGASSSLVDVGRAFGIFIALLAAAGVTFGGWTLWNEEGKPKPGAAGAGGPGAGAPLGQGQAQPYGGQPGGQPQQQAYTPPAGGAAPAAAAPAAQSAPAAAGGAAKADWYPDPRGEKRLRYWDGSQWTDHTAD